LLWNESAWLGLGEEWKERGVAGINSSQATAKIGGREIMWMDFTYTLRGGQGTALCAYVVGRLLETPVVIIWDWRCIACICSEPL
jgi:hypothetical protein